MSLSWYNSLARELALESAATRWVGTPFRDNSAVPGPAGGVDCCRLAAEQHFSTSCLERFTLPAISSRAFLHADPVALLTVIDRQLGARFLAVPVDSAQCAGDLLVVSYHRVAHHVVTVLTGGRCLHVTRDAGALITPLDALFSQLRAPKIVAIRRPAP